jgi:hypothetical protein
MKKVLMGSVEHEVKATRIKGHGYGVRVFLNGEVNSEALAPTRADIGPIARSLLRMEHKCGNVSDHADRARHRQGEKAAKRKLDSL